MLLAVNLSAYYTESVRTLIKPPYKVTGESFNLSSNFLDNAERLVEVNHLLKVVITFTLS